MEPYEEYRRHSGNEDACGSSPDPPDSPSDSDVSPRCVLPWRMTAAPARKHMLHVPGGEFAMGSASTSIRRSSRCDASTWTASGWTSTRSPWPSFAGSSTTPATSPWPSGRPIPISIPTPTPSCWCPARSTFQKTAGPGRPAGVGELVGVDAGRVLAPPGRAGIERRRAGAPSGHPRGLRGCRGVRRVGRRASSRPRPSGSARPAAASTARPTPGARSSPPRAG